MISDGPLKGDIEVTSDNGDLYLLDALGNLTTIATGGLGGAYSSPDWTNGSLFISEADSVWRLSVAVVPEPPTWIMMVFGFAGLGFAGRHRPGNVAMAPWPVKVIGSRRSHLRAA